MNIIDACKLSREISQDAEKLFNDSRYKIKQYVGEVIVYDFSHVAWKVKICSPETWGCYLKVSHFNSQQLRLSVNSYKLYLKVSADEWEVFYRLANGVENVRDRAQVILNRLVE
ncbi:hypothetical protein WA1_07430 [Scytonema hofmannii PCC 7110]|uniref:Uncharacterized protein n=1 Tax=Scytonema hofmannii PCC 7110 TaxID=128403 RepID=A0A139WT93_9CYAN|nr:hypothetical protein [Scytonema hofmannii]KYC35640.1 hypothetical protein WA1_07430 [Scytonema hofmannii PCC 7110]